MGHFSEHYRPSIIVGKLGFAEVDTVNQAADKIPLSVRIQNK